LLDTNLPRKKIFMRLPTAELEHVPAPILPPGYWFATYTPGRCEDWARVETRVGEFSSTEAAVEYFRLVFLAHPDLARKHVQFVFNPAGVAVATASAWFGYAGDGTRVPTLHWVAVDPAEQGRGIGRAVCAQALRCWQGRGQDVWLTTQTWSHVAVGLYHSLGFRLSTDAAFRYDAVENGRLLVRESPNEYAEAVAVLEQVMDPELLEEMTRAAC